LAIELEKQATSDPWFQERSLQSNIDYWTAVVLHTLGFPTDMFPVIMTIPR